MSDSKQRSKSSRPASLITRCSIKLSDLGKRIKNRASIKTVPMFQGGVKGRQSVAIDADPPVYACKYETVRSGKDSGYYMLLERIVSKYWNFVTKDDSVWRELYISEPFFRLKSPTQIFSNQDNSISSKRAIAREILKDSAFPGFRDTYMVRSAIAKRWRKGDLEAKYLEGHKDSVYCMQFDTTKIITGSRDHTVKVWNPKSGKCTYTLKAHSASVLCLKYDEKYMITGSSDCTAVVWALPQFEQVFVLTGHQAGVLDVCFDQEHVVTCSKDARILVWDLKSGTLKRSLQGHRGPVNAVQMAEGKIVSASGDSLVKVWDVETGNCLRDLVGHTRGLACVRFDGKIAISGSNDHSIKMWNVDTGDCLMTMCGHGELVRTLWFDEEWIVSGSYDQTVRVWERATGKAVLDLLKGHSSWIFDVQFDATRVVSTSQDNRIVIWDFSYGLNTKLPALKQRITLIYIYAIIGFILTLCLLILGFTGNLPTNLSTNLPTQMPFSPAQVDGGYKGFPKNGLGEGTFYSPSVGMGACEWLSSDNDFVAALNWKDFGEFPRPSNSPACGACVSISSGGKSVQVKIVDKCPACKEGDIDLSPAAFRQLADESVGRLKIEWRGC